METGKSSIMEDTSASSVVSMAEAETAADEGDGLHLSTEQGIRRSQGRQSILFHLVRIQQQIVPIPWLQANSADHLSCLP